MVLLTRHEGGSWARAIARRPESARRSCDQTAGRRRARSSRTGINGVVMRDGSRTRSIPPGSIKRKWFDIRSPEISQGTESFAQSRLVRPIRVQTCSLCPDDRGGKSRSSSARDARITMTRLDRFAPSRCRRPRQHQGDCRPSSELALQREFSTEQLR